MKRSEVCLSRDNHFPLSAGYVLVNTIMSSIFVSGLCLFVCLVFFVCLVVFVFFFFAAACV